MESTEPRTISLAPHFSLYNRMFAWAGVKNVEAFEDEDGKVSLRWTGDYADPAEHAGLIANEAVNGLLFVYMRDTAGRGLPTPL